MTDSTHAAGPQPDGDVGRATRGWDAFLTERDRRSPTLEGNLTRGTARTAQEVVHVAPAAGFALGPAALRVEISQAIATVDAMRADEERAVLAARPPLLGVARQRLSDHQRRLAAMAAALSRAAPPARP